MRRLVGDLLLLARADAGRELPSGPVDLAAVAAEAARKYRIDDPTAVAGVKQEGAGA